MTYEDEWRQMRADFSSIVKAEYGIDSDLGFELPMKIKHPCGCVSVMNRPRPPAWHEFYAAVCPYHAGHGKTVGLTGVPHD